MENEKALNEDFNVSTSESTTVLDLAKIIWQKINGPDVPFQYVSDEAYEYDVQKRVPSVEKTKRVLEFECTTTLDTMLDEVIPWIEIAMAEGKI